MDLQRPTKPVSRSRKATKQQKQTPNVSNGIQPNGLLFVNVSDPAKSKGANIRNRKAVRSFVMKKYKQSQKSSEAFNSEQMELNEDTDDSVDESLETVRSDDKSSLVSSSGNSCGVDYLSNTTEQHRFPWRTLEHLGKANSPMDILGSGLVDLFDSYPVQMDMRAHELIDLCLLMSAAMACSSKNITQFEPLTLTHHQNNIETLNKDISSNQDLPNVNSTIFTIKTLLLAAIHHKDTYAVRMHFEGAVAVVRKYGSPYRMPRPAQKIIASFVCWTSFAPPNTFLVPFAELVWSSSLYSSSGEDHADKVEARSDFCYSKIINKPPISHHGLRGLHADSGYDNIKTAINWTTESPTNGDGLYKSRTLSHVLRVATKDITVLSLLARRARRSSLTHQELAELVAGICCGGQRLASINPRSLSPLEDCIRMTTLIHYFGDIVLFEDGDEPPIAHLTDSVHAQLPAIDLELMLHEWPEVMLWIAIIVGVFAKAETWMTFQNLLRLTCGHLKILRWAGVISVIDGLQPISSEPFLGCCEAFWLSSQTLKSVRIEGGQMCRHVHVTEEVLR